jgi:hypothetical protein
VRLEFAQITPGTVKGLTGLKEEIGMKGGIENPYFKKPPLPLKGK